MLFLTTFTITVDIENGSLKLSLAILTGAPITVANDAIKMLSFVANKTIKIVKRNNIFTMLFTL